MDTEETIEAMMAAIEEGIEEVTEAEMEVKEVIIEVGEITGVVILTGTTEKMTKMALTAKELESTPEEAEEELVAQEDQILTIEETTEAATLFLEIIKTRSRDLTTAITIKTPRTDFKYF